MNIPNIPRIINIEAVLNGYIVKVGCQRVVFQTREDLMARLGEYLADPDKIQASFLKTALHRDMSLICGAEAVTNRVMGTPVAGWGNVATDPAPEQPMNDPRHF